MPIPIHLEQGLWVKTPKGGWDFMNSVDYHSEAIMVRENESFEDLMTLVRVRLELSVDTPVELIYQFLEWIMLPNAPRSAPANVLEKRDVEVMMSIMDFNDVYV
ncbi:unnamed protein product [Eruca vesicaria subsp. sativa]|uniref:Uncharacterized protein n=1 Tax=Eruca vesicaria subsp. sativa TaxID=29727 RepID=A0ABC8KJD3_ERUVS|nr:unnamed protein product [Eruca vesicaria subsp. sativa]